MIGHAHGVLSNSLGAVMGSASTAKSIASVHPLGLGIVVGIGAYLVVNKYLTNQGEVVTDEISENEQPSETVA